MRLPHPDLLAISTTFPTIDGTPADDAKDVSTVYMEKPQKTSVAWPMNWHKLSPKWRAHLLAMLVSKVIVTVLNPMGQQDPTYLAFRKLTGWGSPDEAKKRGKR